MDVAKWNIVGRYMYPSGPMFKANMTGVPKEEGYDGQYATRNDLVKDGAEALVDNCIRENCYFSAWKDLLLETNREEEQATKPKKKDKQKGRVGKEGPGDSLLKGSNSICRERRHDVFKLLVTYVPEENPGYCKSGCYLMYDKKCVSCLR